VHKNDTYEYVSNGTEYAVHQSNGTSHIDDSPFYLLAAIFPFYDAICIVTLSVTMSRIIQPSVSALLYWAFKSSQFFFPSLPDYFVKENLFT